MPARSFFSRTFKSEEGMMLVQVILVGGVLLTLVYSGFKAVQNTIQSANSTATSAAFQDYLLLIRQHLAVSQLCIGRLGGPITGPRAKQLMQNPSYSTPVSVVWDDGQILAQAETATMKGVPEFRIKEITLTNFRKRGRSQAEAGADRGSQTTERFLGQLTVIAERRSSILGGAEMRGSIDLFFMGKDPTAGTARVMNCSIRSNYQVELGPSVGRVAGIRMKSGLECVDRGGTPVLYPGKDGYICRFPKDSGIYCATMNGNVVGAGHAEGWYCDSTVTDGKDAAYGY